MMVWSDGMIWWYDGMNRDLSSNNQVKITKGSLQKIKPEDPSIQSNRVQDTYNSHTPLHHLIDFHISNPISHHNPKYPSFQYHFNDGLYALPFHSHQLPISPYEKIHEKRSIMNRKRLICEWLVGMEMYDLVWDLRWDMRSNCNEPLYSTSLLALDLIIIIII